jgi:hypothetical protein
MQYRLTGPVLGPAWNWVEGSMQDCFDLDLVDDEGCTFGK